MSTTVIQNPPYTVPFVDSKGMLTTAGINFIKQVYIRLGGSLAPTNSDITTIQNTFTTTNTTLTSLQTDVNILQAEVNGLSVGRQL